MPHLRKCHARLTSRLVAVSAVMLAAIGAGPASSTDESPWAFRAVERPEVPAVKDPAGVRNPIDAFLLQTLEENGLTPAPEADRRTLIRRLTFDLTGLPPSPGEVAAFVSDPRGDAYERLVDQLLASPHYGERWGRHWLDLVRYAETHGYERDSPKPNAWRYRDWVVDAFNRDLPYDRFLTEQLAADELADTTPQALAATGIYRLGLIDDEPADKVQDRFDQLDDVIKTVGTTMLGLTIHCARCHDHKFDPIRQADYYRMVSIFSPGKPYNFGDGNSFEAVLASPEEQRRHAELTATIDRDVKDLNDRVEALRVPRRLALIEERRLGLDNDTIAALQTPADRRDADQKHLAKKAQPAVNPKAEEIDARLTAEEQAEKALVERRIADRNALRPPPLPRALAMTDAGPTAEPTRLLVRGDAHHPGAEIAPAFLSAIDPEPATIAPPPGGKTTGRRLALARWIARADNPLTARVMVNRIWQHHFGLGLVGTPSDFGAMGEEPSNPALLDWLASEFVARGWSLKAMHRLMLTSAAYRRSGHWESAAAEADPADAWLWRMAPRRLEAEPIRDAALSAVGILNLQIGGPSVMPPIDPTVLAGQSKPGDGWHKSDARAAARRSLYVLAKRTLPLPELEVLDAADTSEPCPRRAVTTTAPQALTLLNGPFWHDQAARFADRLRSEAGDDPAAQVDRAFTLTLARQPTDAERLASLEFLRTQAGRIQGRPKPEDRADPRLEALRAFCLALLNTNEFVTVD